MTAPAHDPLVAVICRAPLVGEAVRTALDGVAGVQELPADAGVALLDSLEPDAVVVDSAREAKAAAALASAPRRALVHVAAQEGRIRVLGDAGWQDEAAASPEAIRNIVIGGIFKRRRMK